MTPATINVIKHLLDHPNCSISFGERCIDYELVDLSIKVENGMTIEGRIEWNEHNLIINFTYEILDLGVRFILSRSNDIETLIKDDLSTEYQINHINNELIFINANDNKSRSLKVKLKRSYLYPLLMEVC